MLFAHDTAAREYVLGRFDRDHIADLAEQAKLALAKGETIELAYMPGDMTWYSIIIAPLWNLGSAPSVGATDGHPQSYIGGIGQYVIVHAQSESVAWCSHGDDMEWVASKFATTEASQLAIAELLKAVF